MEMAELSDFINVMDLVDLPSKGNTFTWFIISCSYLSRIANVLISEGLIDFRGLKGKAVGSQEVLDHSPI